MATRTRLIATCIGAVIGVGLAGGQKATELQRPDLAELLRRAETYVGKYVEAFSSVVADEQYVQDLYVEGTTRGRVAHRELRSELVLVAVDHPLGWRPFRDVYEVDGQPVRERAARLEALFTGAAGSDATPQALRIAEESARYNLGPVARTLNTPGLPLGFVRPLLRDRFEFSLDRADGDSWIVRFRERRRPTLFRGDQNSDNPSSGRLWIHAGTGMIRRAEHTLAQLSATATFVTEFGASERFGVHVPLRLTEELRSYARTNPSPTTLVGTATYTNFRAFTVSTDVNIPTSPLGSGLVR
jgi:hypothetical protein